MIRLAALFGKASTPPQEKKSSAPKRITKPFSVRFTPQERAWLEEQAGSRFLGDYIRAAVLADMAEQRRRLRRPGIDSQELAVVLAMLGESRLSSNLNQLAHHANMGTLDISDDVERQLQEAHGAIMEMRDGLMIALGKRPKKARGS